MKTINIKLFTFLSLVMLIANSFAKNNASDESIPSIISSCNEGDLENCYLAANLYLDGDANLKQDKMAGIKFLEKACESGHNDSCVQLGEIYLTGKYVPVNNSQAAYFISKACEGGNMYTCSVLGSMHAKGLGVRRNLDNSVKLFTKACDGNDAFGCFLLAKMHVDGVGVKNNYKKALALYNKSCELGKKESCDELDSLKKKLKVE